MKLATPDPIAVSAALSRAGASIDRAEARLLLAQALSVPRSTLVAHPERGLSQPERDRFEALVSRRAAGEPIAYIVGEREFHGLSLRVTPDVLIPRPETEHLVEQALERIPSGEPRSVLELGTGSGALAIAIARERPGSRLLATDISQAALAVAKGNAERHSVSIEFLQSDWFAELAGRRFDLIVSNPPYVASGDPHLRQGDLRFEPRRALDGGRDGLDCLCLIVERSRDHLHAAGWLLFEHGHDQHLVCQGLLRDAGYEDVSDFPDLSGQPRVCAARWPG